jgi:hypothetical protein
MTLNPNQALLIGMIGGALASFEQIGPVAMETDSQGTYTGRIFIDRPSGRYVVSVEPTDAKEGRG